MKQSRLIILFFLVVFNVVKLYSQVSFTSKASANLIGKTELLEINYELQNAEFENFVAPDFNGWQLVGGPNVSSSTFISNGVRTVSMSYQFILKPLSTGSFIIPGAKAVVSGKSITSNSVKIVVDNKTHGNNSSSVNNNLSPFLDPTPIAPEEDLSEQYDGYILKENENIEEKTKKNLFILINVSKKSCYEGEALTAEYQLYSRVNLNAHITRRPSFSGFSSIDLPDDNDNEYGIKEYKGKQFRVYNVRKVQLYPIQSGKLTLEPVEIEAKIQYKKVPSATGMSHYDPYSPDNNINFPYVVKSDPVVIEVLPFPAENKPANFTSVTGQFSIKATVREAQLAKNQAGTLRVEVEGSGNWTMLQNPKINWPGNVEAFEPTVSEYLDSQMIPVTGKKVYEFPFSCADSGNVNIAPVSISYFDPIKKEYVTASSKPVQVHVLNITLAPNHEDLEPNEKTDFTNIFTEIVVIAFPIIALLLLLWAIVKYRYKRRMEKMPKHWTAPIIQNTSTFNETTDSVDDFNYRPKPNNGPVHTAVEPFTPASQAVSGMAEPATSYVPIDDKTAIQPSKPYFENIKLEIQKLLRNRWNIFDISPATLQSLLVKKGMMSEDAESIVMLLEACEKHIYSPFNENTNTKEWDDIFAEIKFILNKKSYGA